MGNSQDLQQIVWLAEVSMLDKRIDKLVRYLLRQLRLFRVLALPVLEVPRIESCVMAAEPLQDVLDPTPVLQHHTWCLPEVNRQSGAVEPGVLRPGDKIVYAVAKLYFGQT